MTSKVSRAPYRVRCGVCGATVQVDEARLVDICGPVHICSRCCSRCPDFDTIGQTRQERPAGQPGQPHALGPTGLGVPPC